MKESVRKQAKAMKAINDISMKGEIVVFGSTYMSGFPLYELVNKSIFENAVYNRSIEGLTVREALEIVKECVIDIAPSKLFLSLGEEDEGNPLVAEEYARLVAMIRSFLPKCNLYLIGLTGSGAYAKRLNKDLRALCDDRNMEFIEFISERASETALYRARFKQMSCFFRDRPLTVNEAFVIAEL